MCTSSGTRIVLAIAIAFLVTLFDGSQQVAHGATKWRNNCTDHGKRYTKKRRYMLKNNLWGGGDHCMRWSPKRRNFTVVRSESDVPLTSHPGSYAFIARGCHWNDCTRRHGMRKRVRDIRQAKTTWKFKARADGAWNATYDLFFNKKNRRGPPDAAELMIFLKEQGRVIANLGFVPVARNVPLAGARWDVYHYSGVPWIITEQFIIYRRTTDAESVYNLDLKPFLRDAVERGALDEDWYLMAVEAGFEIWNGGNGLRTRDFHVRVR